MSKPIIITVAGGSASGKTTVVEEIKSKCNQSEVTVIRHDDYYKDQTNLLMEERIKVNYDHPFSFDNDLLIEHLSALLKNESIDKPIYDFTIHNRKKETEKLNASKIIILEGILVLEDKRIRNFSDIKIYVETDDDLRFIRRLRRDMHERGRSLDSVVNQYLNTVKPMHFAFVKPTKRYADIIIPNDKNHDVAVDLIITKINSIIS